MRQRRGTLSLALVLVAGLAACGDDEEGDGGMTMPENSPPVAAVEADPTSVPQGDDNQTVVTIDASGSTDPDGDTLSFEWTVPSGTFVNGTTDTDPVIQVTFPGAAPYTVMVVVSDGNGGSDSAQVTIELG